MADHINQGAGPAGEPEIPAAVAWLVHTRPAPFVTMDPPMKGGTRRSGLVTEADARAYGQAMAEHARRVALEEAADRCEAIAHKYMHLTDDRISDAADECKDAIRAAAQTQGGT